VHYAVLRVDVLGHLGRESVCQIFLTHNLHIQILEALCCLYEKKIILIVLLSRPNFPNTYALTTVCVVHDSVFH